MQGRRKPLKEWTIVLSVSPYGDFCYDHKQAGTLESLMSDPSRIIGVDISASASAARLGGIHAIKYLPRRLIGEYFYTLYNLVV